MGVHERGSLPYRKNGERAERGVRGENCADNKWDDEDRIGDWDNNGSLGRWNYGRGRSSRFETQRKSRGNNSGNRDDEDTRTNRYLDREYINGRYYDRNSRERYYDDRRGYDRNSMERYYDNKERYYDDKERYYDDKERYYDDKERYYDDKERYYDDRREYNNDRERYFDNRREYNNDRRYENVEKDRLFSQYKKYDDDKHTGRYSNDNYTWFSKGFTNKRNGEYFNDRRCRYLGNDCRNYNGNDRLFNDDKEKNKKYKENGNDKIENEVKCKENEWISYNESKFVKLEDNNINQIFINKNNKDDECLKIISRTYEPLRRINEYEFTIDEPNTTLRLYKISTQVTIEDIEDVIRNKLPDVEDYNARLRSGNRNMSYDDICILNFSCIEDAVNARKIFSKEVFHGRLITAKYSRKM